MYTERVTTPASRLFAGYGMSPALVTFAGTKCTGFCALHVSAHATASIVGSNAAVKTFKVRFITEFVLSNLFDTSSFRSAQARPTAFQSESYANHQATPKTVLRA